MPKPERPLRSWRLPQGLARCFVLLLFDAARSHTWLTIDMGFPEATTSCLAPNAGIVRSTRIWMMRNCRTFIRTTTRAPASMSMPGRRPRSIELANMVERTSCVRLQLGSASGAGARHRLRLWRVAGISPSAGLRAKGVEADRNILRVAERHGLDVDVGLFDASNYEPASFDVVTLDQVIEHVASPSALLAGIRQVLRPGGTLIVSTPNPEGWGAALFGRRWIHWHAPYHLQFFSRGSMSRLAEQAGFRIDRSATITHSAWLDFQWGHLATYPQPGMPSAYWNASRPRTLTQRILLRLLLVIDRLGTQHRCHAPYGFRRAGRQHGVCLEESWVDAACRRAGSQPGRSDGSFHRCACRSDRESVPSGSCR